MSRIRNLLSVATLVATLFVSVEQCRAQLPHIQITDVKTGSTQSGAIGRIVDQGIMVPTSPGIFAPQNPVTRREFAVSLQRLFAIAPIGGAKPFNDVALTDPDFNVINAMAPYFSKQAFCPGCALNNNLQPEQPISIIEQAVVLTNLLIGRHSVSLVNDGDVPKILGSAPKLSSLAAPARRILATAVQYQVVSAQSLNGLSLAQKVTRASTATLLDSTQVRFKIPVLK